MNNYLSLQQFILNRLRQLTPGDRLIVDALEIKRAFPINPLNIHATNIYDVIYSKLIGSNYGSWYIDFETDAPLYVTFYRCKELDVNVRVASDRTHFFRKVKHKSGLYCYVRHDESVPHCLCSQCGDRVRYQKIIEPEPRLVEPFSQPSAKSELVGYRIEVANCDCIFGVAEKYNLGVIRFD